ncbi:MAG: hypothetical protein AB7P01_14645 [Bacteroidia bacterium]
MKTIFILPLFLIACTIRLQAQDVELTVMYDRTDALQSIPDWKQVKDYFGLKANKWKGVICTLLPITDIRLNKEYKVSIPARNQWFSNELERNGEIKKFQKDIDNALMQLEAIPVGKLQSSIYIPLARKLNEMSERKTCKGELFIYSDMMEHTTGISFYNQKTLRTIKENPAFITSYLEKQCAMKSLCGITIHIFYLPETVQQDEQFEIVSQFFKNMWEGKGATVLIN